MNIALCDDDTSFLNTLDEMIHNYADNHKSLNIITDPYTNAEDLLSKTAPDNPYDIIFMDIYLNSENTGPTGIDIIRSMNITGSPQVVFTTTSREHAIEAFGLDAAHYLLKPLTQADVTSAIERCIDRSNSRHSNSIEVKTKQGLIYIPVENIIYIEVSNKICQIHTTKSCIQTHSSLDSLSEMLDSGIFMRAQRSFTVNMKYIDAFQYDRLLLTDGNEIMLSRKSKAELKEQYQRFLFNLSRKGEY